MAKIKQILLLFSLLFLGNCSVISIDFGESWLKVAMVRIGLRFPLDIVLNTESKRKTPNLLTIKENERFFGGDSLNIISRFPDSTYPRLKLLLGKLYEDESVREYSLQYFNGIMKDPLRGSVAFKNDLFEYFSVEELVAMIFEHVKSFASPDQSVVECVITVPAFFSKTERQAIKTAAEMAGLKVLEIMNDLTAAALSFAMSHSFTEVPEYNIIVDVGAGSTSAAVFSSKNEVFPDPLAIKVEPKNETIEVAPEANSTNSTQPAVKTLSKPLVEVLSTAHQNGIGGTAIDIRLQKYFAQKFQEKFPHLHVLSHPRAMAKLLKEATHVKHILSANDKIYSQIENLVDDTDFALEVTRATLEDLCKDLSDLFVAPIKKALEEANIGLDNINSLIVIGGGWYVPFVQRAIKEFAGTKFSPSMNPDESIAIGAGFRAALLSKRFVIGKEILVKESFKGSSETVDIRDFTEEEKKASLIKLKKFDEFDSQRKAKSDALNDLEAFVYKVRDRISSPEYIAASSPSELEALEISANNVLDNFQEFSKTETSLLIKKLADIKTLDSPISFRLKEAESRDRNISSLKEVLDKAEKYSIETKQKYSPEDRGQSDAQLDSLLSTVKATREWLSSKVEEQSKLAPNVTPVLLSNEMSSKEKTVILEHELLLKKKVPRKPKKEEPKPTEEESKKESNEEPIKESKEEESKKEEISTETVHVADSTTSVPQPEKIPDVRESQVPDAHSNIEHDEL